MFIYLIGNSNRNIVINLVLLFQNIQIYLIYALKLLLTTSIWYLLYEPPAIIVGILQSIA